MRVVLKEVLPALIPGIIVGAVVWAITAAYYENEAAKKQTEIRAQIQARDAQLDQMRMFIGFAKSDLKAALKSLEDAEKVK